MAAPTQEKVPPAAKGLLERLLGILDKGHDAWTKSDVDYLLTVCPRRIRSPMIQLLDFVDEYAGMESEEMTRLERWAKRTLAASIDWDPLLYPDKRRNWIARLRFKAGELSVARDVERQMQ